MKRTLFSLALVILTAFLNLGLCSCGETKTTSQVYLLNYNEESASAYKEIADAYQKETGVKIKVVDSDADGYDETLKSEFAKSDAPTIFRLNGFLGYKAWSAYCTDLKDSKLYSSLVDKDMAVSDGDGVYAIPYSVEGYGIVYNDAVMKKYFALPDKKSNLTSANEIDSFEKLKTVVEDMTANREKLGIKGVFAATSLASGEDSRWKTHLLNIPLYYEFGETGGDKNVFLTMLDADEIEYKYNKNFSNIFDLYINNSTAEKSLLSSKSVADSVKEFASGEAAMMQNDNRSWSQISGVEGNTVKGEDIKMLPIYTGIEGEKGQGICIGAENYFAINKNSTEEQQKASLKFLEWLFTSDNGKKLVTEKLNIITPFNTFGQNDLPDNPLSKEVVRYMNDNSYKNIPWIFGAFPSEAFTDGVSNLLIDYVQGKRKWEEVKDTIKEKWKSEWSKISIK